VKKRISFATVAGVAALAGLVPREAAAQPSSFDDCPIVKLQEDESPEAIKAHMRAGIEASRKETGKAPGWPSGALGVASTP
jgi:hypothetical protein